MISNLIRSATHLITHKNIISPIITKQPISLIISTTNNSNNSSNNNNNYNNSNTIPIMSSRISRRSTSISSSNSNNTNKIKDNSDIDGSSEEEKSNQKVIVKKTKSTTTTKSTTNKSTNSNKSTDNNISADNGKSKKQLNSKNNNSGSDSNNEIDKLTGKPIPEYSDGIKRCPWVPPKNKVYLDYHDNEWGRVEKNSLKLFEKICLESQQAGLSWITVLVKREEYRRCFYNFDPYKIKDMGEKELDQLMKNENLIRNRAKLSAIISNAQAYCKMVDAGEDFSKFIWSFVNNTTKIGQYALKGVPLTKDESSEAMSKELKKKGFKFVGPVCLYSFQQSMGLINDHHQKCEFNPLNQSKSI